MACNEHSGIVARQESVEKRTDNLEKKTDSHEKQLSVLRGIGILIAFEIPACLTILKMWQ